MISRLDNIRLNRRFILSFPSLHVSLLFKDRGTLLRCFFWDLFQYFCRNASYYHSGRNIFRYHGSCSNNGVVSKGYSRQYRSIRAYPYMSAYRYGNS